MKNLRVLINIAIILFSIFFSKSFSQVLTEEFSYTATEDLTSNGWTAFSAEGLTPILVTSGNLSYTDYTSSGIGNSATVDGGSGSREDVEKKFTAQSSGSVYISFLVNFSAATTAGDGDYFLGLQSSSSSTFIGRVYVKKSGSDIAFGISKSGTTPNLSAFSYSLNATYLLVVKYTFNDLSSDDVINLFINPDLSGSEPSPDLTNADTDTDLSNLGGIGLRQGLNSYTLQIDGIRVATSWSQSPLPVELTSFSALPNGNSVQLNWSTATEINNYGFEIERASSSTTLRQDWNKIGFVPGHGNSNLPIDYSFIDNNPLGGTSFYYRLKQIDVDGNFEYSDALLVNLNISDKPKLLQNTPNPFNPSTSIKFFIPTQSDVTIKVYDLLGREVTTLINNNLGEGFHIVFWNGVDKQGKFVSSGVYLYRLTAVASTSTSTSSVQSSVQSSTTVFTETKKMTLLK